MTDNEVRAIRDGDVAAWLSAYEVDAPLYSQMPVALTNGESVPGLHIVCKKCGHNLSGDRVRGRVIRSLRHVVTISANGFCEPCDQITHIDCRLRANVEETLIEWLGANGTWQGREYRRPTLTAKITKRLRRLLAK